MSSLPRRFLPERKKRNLFPFLFQRTRFRLYFRTRQEFKDKSQDKGGVPDSGISGQSVNLSKRVELWDFNVPHLATLRTIFKFFYFQLCKVSCVFKNYKIADWNSPLGSERRKFYDGMVRRLNYWWLISNLDIFQPSTRNKWTKFYIFMCWNLFLRKMASASQKP